MLPSPLGYLEYDVLEDAVFLGPGKKGAVRARPTPFQGAQVALKRADDGFRVRPLPGEAEPEINGEPAGERLLADGDRIRLGEFVVMFRTSRGVPVAPSTPAATPPPRPPRAERRESVRRRNPVGTIVLFAGLVILLAAAYRAANHMKALKSARSAGNELPELQPYETEEPGRRGRELAELMAEVGPDPSRPQEAVLRFQSFQRKHVGSVEADIAAERIRELMATWSVKERAKLDAEITRLLEAQQYARALKAIDTFEGRFGTTEAATGLDALRARVRTQAEDTLEKLVAKVGPLIHPQPREAHRLLIGVSHQFPPDLAARVVRMIERCVQRMLETRGAGAVKDLPRRPAPPRDGPKPADAPKRPPPPDDAPRVPEAPAAGPAREAQCLDAWRAARAHLLESRYAEALQGYTLVQQQYAATEAFETHKAKILAGARAARAGALGPQALLNVPVEVKKDDRLEMEYHFNDQRVFDEDWTLEQPFSSEMPVEGAWKRGNVTLEKATGLLHRLVFLADVRIEATVTVHQPHDFGLIAMQESDDYRAVLFNVGNTLFKLKKGDNRKENRGHILWYIGQGVWSAADEDAHGFIKIAERAKVTLQSGDRVKLELVRREDRLQGTLQGKTDGVNLDGRVKGDDGSTMGSARVGVFTNSGVIVVHGVRISGRVDMEWFRKELAFLVAADPGPPDND